MGIARIVSGGTNGRYTIELDYGSSVRDARVAAIQTAITQLQARRVKAAAKLAEKSAKVQDARDALEAAIQSYAIAAQVGTADELATAERAFLGAQQAVELAVATERPYKANVATIDLDLRRLNFQLAQYQNLQMIETRQAWCVELSEDMTGFRPTCDVPGESGLILLGPASWAASRAQHGQFVAREVLSPEHAFFNAAILPGWQKFKPTFRRGTITRLNYDEDLADVTLAAAVSSAQALDVNQATALVDVPITYMACNAQSFEIDDQVIVMFDGQDWEAPRVIGFVTDPRGCGWACIGATRVGGGSIVYYGTTVQAEIDAILAAPAAAWWGRGQYTGGVEFTQFIDDVWPNSTPASGGASHSYTITADAVFFNHYWGSGFNRASINIEVARPGVSLTTLLSPGLEIPGYVGFAAMTNIANDSNNLGTIFPTPDRWSEVKVEVDGQIIFNTAMTSTVQQIPDVAIKGGIRRLIGDKPDKFNHLLAIDGV